MKISLNENIRNYRKGMSLTQEQLAEAMGVSVATVSKWEGGTVSPDVEMLAELADFFQTSVDVLLGYQLKKRSMEEYAEKLKQYGSEPGQFAEGVAEARKAVQRFPYSFPILYTSGRLLFVTAIRDAEGILTSNEKAKADLTYAKELLERALSVFEQNEDKTISRESIHQIIGNIYGYLGNNKQAIEYLEKYNICNVNDQMIGIFYSSIGEYEKAAEYAYRTFQRNVINVWASSTAVFNVLIQTGKYDELLQIMQWTKEFCQSVGAEDSSYFERCVVLTDSMMASVYLHKEEAEKTDYHENVEEHLRMAVKAAIHFEEHPDYTGKLKFFPVGENMFHDSFGGNAIRVIKNTLLLHKEKKQYQYLADLFCKICKEFGLENEYLD